MTLPQFTNNDPGASFHQLLRTQGFSAPVPSMHRDGPDHIGPLTHATTIVALRYADGVIMAGDRRATAGNVIAHRGMEKVFPADRHSGVSISGVAGVAAEMVKLFQLELEHYEKVEGVQLSLEGKATRLANLIRNNLPMAMQAGMVVIPIFAGYDLRRQVGRIFNYDITGGRYEEMEFHATGSGGTYARMLIKQQWRPDIGVEDAIELSLAALFEAADEDSATGGPDAIRGIYPTVASITSAGYTDIDEADISERFASLIAQRTATRNGGGSGGGTSGGQASTSAPARAARGTRGGAK
jgi:proteasome beta subunit